MVTFKYLPSPSSLSYCWNFGSLLGLFLVIQIMSGLLSASMYSVDELVYLLRSVSGAWFVQSIHANGASFFFLLLMSHLGRGFYYSLSWKVHVWYTGVTLLLLSMLTAFLGYVLPWGQMSYWGSTVITSLMSTIPLIGEDLVMWLWGGFSPSKGTLVRFYTLHYLLPFIILFFMLVHLYFLHQVGSSSPSGLNSYIDMIPFYPLFMVKDLLTAVISLSILVCLSIYNPYLLMDPDNFIPVDAMLTPIHIQPEWYFLFAYAILRSVPSKLFGVIGLVLSLMVLYILPFMSKWSHPFSPLKRFLFWFLVFNFFLLSWLGAQPVESPYLVLSRLSSFVYFFLLLIG